MTWSKLENGVGYQFALFQTDVDKSSSYDAGDRERQEIFELLHHFIVARVKMYDGRYWDWALEGGIFAFSHDKSNKDDLFTKCVKSAIDVAESLAIFNRIHKGSASPPLRLRISAHIAQVTYHKTPGFNVGEELSAFMKWERELGRVGCVRITHSLYKNLRKDLRELFHEDKPAEIVVAGEKRTYRMYEYSPRMVWCDTANPVQIIHDLRHQLTEAENRFEELKERVLETATADTIEKRRRVHEIKISYLQHAIKVLLETAVRINHPDRVRRSSVFLPVPHENKLHMVYHVNFEGHRDCGITIPVGDGCSGSAFATNQPVYGNNRKAGIWTLDTNTMKRVPKGLKCILSTPIPGNGAGQADAVGVFSIDSFDTADLEEFKSEEFMGNMRVFAAYVGTLVREVQELAISVP